MQQLSRRTFLKASAALGAAAAAGGVGHSVGLVGRARAAKSPQVPLAAKAIPQFVDAVPNLLAAEGLIVDDGSRSSSQIGSTRSGSCRPAPWRDTPGPGCGAT